MAKVTTKKKTNRNGSVSVQKATAMRNAKHRAEVKSTMKGIHRNGKILDAVAAKKKKKKK